MVCPFPLVDNAFFQPISSNKYEGQCPTIRRYTRIHNHSSRNVGFLQRMARNRTNPCPIIISLGLGEGELCKTSIRACAIYIQEQGVRRSKVGRKPGKKISTDIPMTRLTLSLYKQLFITIATILSTCDINRAIGKDGKPIEPDDEYETGFVK